MLFFGAMSAPGARRALLALVGLSMLVSGCGGSKSPSVASLGKTASGGAGTSVSSAPTGGVFPIGSSMSTDVGTGAAGVRYAACMRSHGLPNYPDPDSQGVITITISSSLNPVAPGFQEAEGDCKSLLPPGKPLSQARQQQMKTRLLAFAACMRSHGVPGYPDPTFGGGGMVSQSIDKNSVDPSSPIYQAAQNACRGKVSAGG
jgi:hypothetical protein